MYPHLGQRRLPWKSYRAAREGRLPGRRLALGCLASSDAAALSLGHGDLLEGVDKASGGKPSSDAKNSESLLFTENPAGRLELSTCSLPRARDPA